MRASELIAKLQAAGLDRIVFIESDDGPWGIREVAVDLDGDIIIN